MPPCRRGGAGHGARLLGITCAASGVRRNCRTQQPRRRPHGTVQLRRRPRHLRASGGRASRSARPAGQPRHRDAESSARRRCRPGARDPRTGLGRRSRGLESPLQPRPAAAERWARRRGAAAVCLRGRARARRRVCGVLRGALPLPAGRFRRCADRLSASGEPSTLTCAAPFTASRRPCSGSAEPRTPSGD